MTSLPLQQPTLGYILKGYPRISETFISNEILLLERLGFRMHLFPMRQPRENFCHESVKQIRAQVDYLPTELLPEFHRLLPANIFLSVKSPQRYKRALITAGQGLSPGKILATSKHLLQAGYLTHYHLTEKSGVVQLHGHFAHSPTSVTMFASQLSGIPFSFTAHAKDIYTSNPKKIKRKIDNAAFVVTCTQHNKEYLTKIAENSNTPIYCVYHGIDLSLFTNNHQKQNNKTPYTILTIARMTEKKGLPTIYKALALLKDKGIPFQHTLIGDGDDRKKILSLISSLDLEDSCNWLGTKSHEEVLSHFQASDLFVLGCEIAKNGDRDGIPNVLVESLAMGVPAISTNVSAIPEILYNNETGIVVEPSQPDQLAGAMEKVLTSPPLQEKLRDQGRRFVQNNFDNAEWIKKLHSIFLKHNDALKRADHN